MDMVAWVTSVIIFILPVLLVYISRRKKKYWDLRSEINRLGGNVPAYPELNEQSIVKGIVTRIVQGSRMMLSFNHSNDPHIKPIPQDNYVVHENNIANIIADPCGISKQQLPEIMNAVLKRASR